ncbi:polysaccharide export outer membrane protein [Salinimicrobium catena]|uniref:Polysaccharide export outer membrane protein n=1 Tax=Salinimicrobium catena TaxID=390640 RepID=A0A1H5PDQ5_9FLAO|nr:polysaccharide biosynthesis/export family protein [Salinimicrobium catena]SDL80684.1 polysaccharide export outer membrane protein [Salinimicrobium catena]SEF12033.1 polysaccharide export outer membrane protein [Salinimicrobium catena]
MKTRSTSPILLGILSLLLMGSCVSRKKMAYFQNMEELKSAVDESKTELEIQPNDLLTITVSAANIEAVQPFNLPVTSAPRVGEPGSVSGNMQLQSYLVDSDGNIEFPVLGTVHVAGLTRQQLTEKLKKQIAAYVQDPIVNIKLINFQVTVLGEVNRPGTYTVPDERLSLTKALGLAGDLTIYGRRDNVMILRETGDTKEYKYVDLTQSDFLTSPYYYLQQNDVVYVEPNSAQMQGASYNRNASVYISIASVLISLIIVIIR